MIRVDAPKLVFWAICATLISRLVGLVDGATLAEWRSRSIYQVVTDRFAVTNGSIDVPCDVSDGLYCGGSWKGIANQLDYIQGMNFDAIWISPIVAQLDGRTPEGEACMAYWQQNLYGLNSHFGSEQDLKDLISEIHRRGMYLMLDVVVNHMAWAGAGTQVDYSVFDPFNDRKYFHDYCSVTNPLNQTNNEMCWLGDSTVALADLRTEDQDVRDLFSTWVSGLVANYSIDGMRLDSAYNVDADFFPGFLKSAGVFATGEVFASNASLACQWASTIGSILNYPVYFPLVQAFQGYTGSIAPLVDAINSVKQNCPNSAAFGSFSENHDVQRFASYTDDLALAKNILTFTMMADGIPIVYQGQEQHMQGGISHAANRAPLWQSGYNTSAVLYQHIATLNQFRHHVLQASTNYTDYLGVIVYQDEHSFAMRKGFDGSQVIAVYNNNGQSAGNYVLHVLEHGFAPGVELTEILTCDKVSVNGSGWLDVPSGQGEPRVFYPSSLMANSSLCGASGPPPLIVSTTVPVDITIIVDGTTTVMHTQTLDLITEAPTGLPATATNSGPASSSTKSGSISRILTAGQFITSFAGTALSIALVVCTTM